MANVIGIAFECILGMHHCIIMYTVPTKKVSQMFLR